MWDDYSPLFRLSLRGPEKSRKLKVENEAKNPVNIKGEQPQLSAHYILLALGN